ncbi:MAG: hypothetical protein RLZZ511_4141 [Cyanobacteriota bacterium]|jgi:hypothetical protein
MVALVVNCKPAPLDLSPAQLAKLTATARSKGCDALMVNLAPAPGCQVSVLWSEVGA